MVDCKNKKRMKKKKINSTRTCQFKYKINGGHMSDAKMNDV